VNDRAGIASSILAHTLLTGALLGSFEVLLVFGTGYAPPWEVTPIMVVDVTLALCAAALGALALHPRIGGNPLRGAQLGLLLAPVVVFTSRGQVDPHQVAYPWATALRVLFAGLATAVILLAVRPRGQGDALSPRRFGILCAALASSASATFALRTIDHFAARDVYRRAPLVHLGAALLALLLLLFGYLILFSSRSGRSRPAQSWALVGGAVYAVGVSAGVAWAEGARLPSFDTHAAPATRPGGARPESANVVLIVMDTARRDRLSVYDHDRSTSPFLESLASSSLVFDRAYAPSTYSLSSHASIFTGLPPSVHGAHPLDASEPDIARRWILGNRFHAALRPQVPTIAQELSAAGYHTAGITGNDVFLAEWTGLQRGFEDFASQAFRSYRYVPTAQPILARAGLGARYPYHQSWPADAIARLAMRWVDGVRGSGQPFFLFLNFFDAHTPQLPPAPYDEMFLPPRGRPGMTEVAYELSQYDGAIAFVDGQIGRLVSFLRERRLLEQTLIIVTSDHGEFFGEHGLHGHASALYEEVLRVPLLVRLPGQHARIDITSPVSLMRLPELIRLSAIEQSSPAEMARRMSSATPQMVSGVFVGRGKAPPRYSRVVVDDRWKLIVHSERDPELYDLRADPGETQDLWARAPAEAAHLTRNIRRWLKLSGSEDQGNTPQLPADVLERLESLGYLSE
jgi:arylsulfatase A-like enzyme